MFWPPDPTKPFAGFDLLEVPQRYELITLSFPYPELSIPFLFQPFPQKVHGRELDSAENLYGETLAELLRVNWSFDEEDVS